MESIGYAVFECCGGIAGGTRNTEYLSEMCIGCPYFTEIDIKYMKKEKGLNRWKFPFIAKITSFGGVFLTKICLKIHIWGDKQMNNVKVTKQFVEYSKELAEDILGYNRCFHYGHMDNGTNRKLIYHIKRCEKLLSETKK